MFTKHLMSTFKKCALFSVVIGIAVLLFADEASAQVPGAIFTTTSDCIGTNVNIFESKQDVYLDGGPRKEGSAGLPDGDYYVKVTEPNGTLLGYTVDASVVVFGGEFVTCYQLWDILVYPDGTTPGYETTSNQGGEYKVWISKNSDFPNNESKTDNFKVKVGGGGDPDDTFTLKGCKFFDANGDGVWDELEPAIPGFMIIVYINGVADDPIFTDENGCYERTGIEAGAEFAVREVLPNEFWYQTSPEEVEIDLGNGVETLRVHTGFAEGGECDEGVCVIDDLDFGNFCTTQSEGGKTLGFWSNRNGRNALTAYNNGSNNIYQELCDLNLVDAAGDPFCPADHADLNTWLLNGNATNMAYMLSVQLAATYLNVVVGGQDDSQVVFYNGIVQGTIAELIDEANASLLAHPVTLAGSEFRARQEELKNIFDLLNNNEAQVISSEICEFGYFFEEDCTTGLPIIPGIYDGEPCPELFWDTCEGIWVPEPPLYQCGDCYDNDGDGLCDS